MCKFFNGERNSTRKKKKEKKKFQSLCAVFLMVKEIHYLCLSDQDNFVTVKMSKEECPDCT